MIGIEKLENNNATKQKKQNKYKEKAFNDIVINGRMPSEVPFVRCRGVRCTHQF